mmetsp:Transcript_326/g.763  ORF Transcript_326/g.763 Transcript_326/m.763 type:complete len:217 (+) Transcript_326:945-1595(+)
MGRIVAVWIITRGCFCCMTMRMRMALVGAVCLCTSSCHSFVLSVLMSVTVPLTVSLLSLKIQYRQLSQQFLHSHPPKLHLHNRSIFIQSPCHTTRDLRLLLTRQINLVHQEQIGRLHLLRQQLGHLTNRRAIVSFLRPPISIPRCIPCHPIGTKGTRVNKRHCPLQIRQLGGRMPGNLGLLPIIPHCHWIGHSRQFYHNSVQFTFATLRQSFHRGE